MSTQEKPFSWFELQTHDVDGAVNFYTTVVPWETSVWEGEVGGEPYTMWTVGEAMVGGIMPLPEDARDERARPMWLGYVTVDDLEEKLGHLETAGGTDETGVIDIGEVGRFAVVSDPQGAIFALHESASEEEATVLEQNEPGAVSWAELTTTDVDAAWSFYSELFGWKASERMEVQGGIQYQMFGWNDRDRGGMADNANEDVPPQWLFYVTVEDLETSLDSVRDGGGQVLNGPMEVPGGAHIAQCMDPEGAAFALHSPGRPSE